jgi:hypothetical protein
MLILSQEKRIMSRGPRITQQQRDQWLEQYEEGVPIVKIASKANADPRTVKLHIEQAQKEKKREKVFFAAALNALEAHFRDIIKFAKKMEKTLGSNQYASSSFEDDPMWDALKKHIPKSIIWRNIQAREVCLDGLQQLGQVVSSRLKVQIEKQTSIPFVAIDSEGLYDGMLQSLVVHFKAKAMGQFGFTIDDNFIAETANDNLTLIRLGGYSIGLVPENEIENITTMISALLDEVIGFPEFAPTEKLYDDLERIKKQLLDEFQTIILRRMIQGKCKYCK